MILLIHNTLQSIHKKTDIATNAMPVKSTLFPVEVAEQEQGAKFFATFKALFVVTAEKLKLIILPPQPIK